MSPTTLCSCAPATGSGPTSPSTGSAETLHVPPRLHLDLYTDDQDGEVKRLIARGATEVPWSKRPPDADYVILADPEGNRISRRGHDPLAADRLALASSTAAMLPPLLVW